MLKLGSVDDWCWRQWWKDMSDGEDEYFVLLYTPFGGGVHSLNNWTIQNYPDSVCIWAEDHDLTGPNYQYWNESRQDFERLNSEAGWSLVKDETISLNNPLYMDAKEFEENPWFFTPGTCSKGEGQLYLRWTRLVINLIYSVSFGNLILLQSESSLLQLMQTVKVKLLPVNVCNRLG